MTREEREAAIEYIKGYRKLDEDLHNTSPKDSISYYATDKCLKYWDMAIQALSQEPCDECKYKTFTELYFHTDPEMVEQEPCKTCGYAEGSQFCLQYCPYDVERKKEQEPMREFTEEEAKAYSKALDKMYKPTGFNVFDEPCDDAISRDAALEIQAKYAEHMRATKFWQMRDDIKALPSVTQKSGKWILLDECANSGYYCSNCQKKLVKEGWSNTVKKIKYCPNCGAKMESEDKE